MPQIAALVRSHEQLAALLSAEPPPALIWCDLRDIGDAAGAVSLARRAGRPVGLATPRVLHPGEEGLLDQLGRARPDAVLVRSLGAANHLRSTFPDVRLVGDAALNVANDLAAAAWRAEGLERLTPALDLDGVRLAALLDRAPPAWFEVIVYQHVPLFHTRHCLYAATLAAPPGHAACDADRAVNENRAIGAAIRCGNCGWPCRSHDLRLRDARGACYPVRVDAAGRSTVFAPTAEDRLSASGRLLRRGVPWLRVELLDETPVEALRILARAYDSIVASTR